MKKLSDLITFTKRSDPLEDDILLERLARLDNECQRPPPLFNLFRTLPLRQAA